MRVQVYAWVHMAYSGKILLSVSLYFSVHTPTGSSKICSDGDGHGDGDSGDGDGDDNDNDGDDGNGDGDGDGDGGDDSADHSNTGVGGSFVCPHAHNTRHL
jgi:hypothetical protein